MESSKQWRRDHPFGFFAKPARTAQGVLDLRKWECGVPGKDKTVWEGGLFKLDVIFPDGTYLFIFDEQTSLTIYVEYPTKPPKCTWNTSLKDSKSCSNVRRQIHPASISSKCLSIRHRLLINIERGRRLEACYYHQTDSSWNSRFAKRS